jgi:hypothetical protein|tara:strand:+ start:7045 stop:7506 length:462 start_codon:yes stop_codon:yes gene_type:complete
MKPEPNYWKSDALIPSDIKKSFNRYFTVFLSEMIMKQTTISFDSEERDIVLRFNENVFGFEFPEDVVSEVVNGQENSDNWSHLMAPWGRRTNSIIYNKLLEVLNETHRKEINRYCDNAMREVMWKFLNYLGVADNMHYGELDNDNIWETIHNE